MKKDNLDGDVDDDEGIYMVEGWCTMHGVGGGGMFVDL